MHPARAMGITGTSHGKVYCLFVKKKAWYLPSYIDKSAWRGVFITTFPDGSRALKCHSTVGVNVPQ